MLVYSNQIIKQEPDIPLRQRFPAMFADKNHPNHDSIQYDELLLVKNIVFVYGGGTPSADRVSQAIRHFTIKDIIQQLNILYQ